MPDDGFDDFQTPGLHCNYHPLLPDELRLWTTGQKERWALEDVRALRDYLTRVAEAMVQAQPSPEGD
jgi:hypothetical protein